MKAFMYVCQEEYIMSPGKSTLTSIEIEHMHLCGRLLLLVCVHECTGAHLSTTY